MGHLGRRAFPIQLVYEITKSLWSEPTRKFLVARHIIGRRIAPEHALDALDIPLHPGAERYYRRTSCSPIPPNSGAK